jgi:mannan endo-1,4-beta-mannosidase
MLFLAGCSQKPDRNAFVTVIDGHFSVAQKPYYYIGTNFWYGAILASTGEGGNRERLARELDLMQQVGINNLRILVGADGERGVHSKVEPTLQIAPEIYNDTILDGLDFLMSELGKRGMYAVLYLNNSWEWSGGYGQYLQWAGEGVAPVPNVDGWGAYMSFVEKFQQNDKAKALFSNYVRFIVGRTNRYTHKPYSEDTALMSWQIGNEPRAFSEANKEAFAAWIGDVAKLIKSIDKNHLVSVGSEGKHGCEDDLALWEKIHSYPEIDYGTFHIWAYNWGWITKENLNEAERIAFSEAQTEQYINEHLLVLEKYGKPSVLEEFGYPRDNFSFETGSPVTARDKYFAYVFDLIAKASVEKNSFAGCNFWGWGGFAKPATDHIYWAFGDDYTGDPAQEEQGLNSIFATDSTLKVISEAIGKMNGER